MHFKLICAFVQDDKTIAVMNAAREKGATGATVITSAHGEGLEVRKTFFGLSLETQRDVILFLVEEHLAREILESIATVGNSMSNLERGSRFRLMWKMRWAWCIKWQNSETSWRKSYETW